MSHQQAHVALCPRLRKEYQVQHGALVKTTNECGASGVACSQAATKRAAQEMRSQEHLSDLVLEETGQVSGTSFSPNKKGKVGRTPKLTAPVKEAFRSTIQRYAYSWTRLSEGKLKWELDTASFHFSRSTVHEHLKALKKRYKTTKLKPLLVAENSSLRSIMHELGGSEYKQAHSGGQKRKRENGTSVDLSVN